MKWIPPDLEKAKGVVGTLIEAGGGRFESKTRLNAAFWWAHLHFYRHHEGLLSRYPIARLPEGPAILDADDLIADLERQERIKVAITSAGGCPQYHFELLPADSLPLTDDAIDSIRAAWAWVKSKSAAEASLESRKLSRGWRSGRDGDIIDYANDALSEADLMESQKTIQAMDDNLKWAGKMISDAFSEGGQARQVL